MEICGDVFLYFCVILLMSYGLTKKEEGQNSVFVVEFLNCTKVRQSSRVVVQYASEVDLLELLWLDCASCLCVHSLYPMYRLSSLYMELLLHFVMICFG